MPKNSRFILSSFYLYKGQSRHNQISAALVNLLETGVDGNKTERIQMGPKIAESSPKKQIIFKYLPRSKSYFG